MYEHDKYKRGIMTLSTDNHDELGLEMTYEEFVELVTSYNLFDFWDHYDHYQQASENKENVGANE